MLVDGFGQKKKDDAVEGGLDEKPRPLLF